MSASPRAEDWIPASRCGTLERNPPLPHQLLDHLAGPADDVAHHHGLDVIANRATLEAREAQQIVDQSRERHLAAMNFFEIGLLCFGNRTPDAEGDQLGEPADRIEWRPEFVARDGEEVALRPVGALRIEPRRFGLLQEQFPLRLAGFAKTDVSEDTHDTGFDVAVPPDTMGAHRQPEVADRQLDAPRGKSRRHARASPLPWPTPKAASKTASMGCPTISVEGRFTRSAAARLDRRTTPASFTRKMASPIASKVATHSSAACRSRRSGPPHP